MSASSFGSRFIVTSFGESHGTALGVVIDGCPAGLKFDENLLTKELERRRPGGDLVSQRKEEDLPEILSGVFEGKTLGTPIAIIVRNKDQKSQDYEAIKNSPRAGHADDVWQQKFGHRDFRGGGRSSGRETVTRVMAGAVAQMLCKQLAPEMQLKAYSAQVGPHSLTEADREKIWQQDVDQFTARFPSAQHERVRELLTMAQSQGESYGGVAEIRIKGAPKGLGQPVFHKLKADLAAAYMSVGATAGVELGAGAEATQEKGTAFHQESQSENYGGIRGGISTGEEIFLKVHFKPTSSILDIAKKGRHDPYIVTRAVPVLEAMTWLVLADHLLWQRGDQV
ncbi:chorismate synthase [Bdellovibrio sp. HCB337]|uniref:chorismate synthase n=1 Tax=Bdellovibrio sp. HCB337 TaxID=3394358 RepID=UPI0039A5A783